MYNIPSGKKHIWHNFTTYRLDYFPHKQCGMVFNTLNRPNPDEGSNTGVCLTDFTGQNKRNDKRPIADTISLYLLAYLVEG